MRRQRNAKPRPARAQTASKPETAPAAGLTARELLMVLWVVGVLAAFWRIFIGMLG